MKTDKLVDKLTRRHQSYSLAHPAASFELRLPDGAKHVIGAGGPRFTIVVTDGHGLNALASLDRLQIATAYIEGQLDLEGDMIAALAMRGMFADFHPLSWLIRYLPALVRGGQEHDRRSISAHYDREPDFFFTFMDQRHHCYTQGSFAGDDEPLEDAMTRKLDVAIDSIGLKAGDHVLEVGGGWGAFLEHAAKRDIRVTSLTLSKESEQYLQRIINEKALPATVVRQHLLGYETRERYDAIVNMGVTEHLPDYRASLRKYAELLRPGGNVYLDALAMRAKHRVSTFMSRFIYPGTSTPLLLHEYLKRVARSPFLLTGLYDERHNYYLTCKAWAQRLEAARDEIQRRWGDHLYRRFRLFLWGSAASFATGKVQAYRWTLQLPA